MFNQGNLPFTMNVEPAGNNGGWGGDGYGAWIWIILILAIFGWGNGGYGFGNGGAGAAENYVLASDFATLQRIIQEGNSNIDRKLDAQNAGICDLGYTNAQLINGVNTNVYQTGNAILAQMNNNAINGMQDNFAIQTAINGVNVNNNVNTQAVLAAMNANEAARQACCCATDNLITTSFGNLRYDTAAQDCQTRQTINDVGRNLADVGNANTQAILSAIQSIKDDAKDEKIASLQARLTEMKSVADNAAQTTAFTNAINAAVDQLRMPTPQPAFVVPNPWQYNGCSCNCGC